MLRKTLVYVFLAAIVGVVVMLAPLTATPSQQSTLTPQETTPLPAKEYSQKIEETKTTQTTETGETGRFSMTQSIIPIILILVLSLPPAFVVSVYIKKRIS